ncbi:LOW QUALITY PROTEIN: protein FAM229A [Thomomys bottae]
MQPFGGPPWPPAPPWGADVQTRWLGPVAPAWVGTECPGSPGFPGGGTGSVRSQCRPSTRARGPGARRHLPGSAWTGASSRGLGSGSCFQPGTGLGLGLWQSALGLDMSAQEPPQGRRFPIEAGDSPGLAAAPEAQDSPEPVVATEHNPVRPLRRCPGCHCLTLLHVPIDVYLAMGGSPRARAT